MTTRTIPIRPRSWPLLLLTCSLASRAHADTPPDGMEVLLFREQALVTRTRPLACRPGASGRLVARFDRLPAAADRHSVRAQGRGATVAGVRLIEIDGQSEASAARAARLAALDRQIAVARDVRNRLVLRDLELSSYQSTVTTVVERQLRLGTVDPASWQRAYAALDRGGRDQAAAWADADPALARLVAERARVEQDNQASAAANSFACEVIATCQGAAAELRISYLVTGAGWTPLYDLDARDGGKSVTLSTYASVRQSTGEDWRQARLTLTTADPTLHATPPQLIPLDVRAQPRDPPRRQAVSRTEAVPVADQVAPGAAAAQAALPASDQGLSVRLAPPVPADVPGDGTTVRILAATLALPGRPLLRAIPRASEAVYRVVELANRAPFPLLPGPMKVFRDGSFAGSQPLHRVVPRGATLAVSLGLEERVSLRRIVLEEIAETAGLFRGLRQHRFAYRFELESHLDGPATVELVDHLPVSQLDDIRVVIDPARSRGWITDPQHGLSRRPTPLAPRGKATAELAFRIDVPRAYD
jgi:uncharacterized protein (TIGR02231 family)